MLLPTLARSKDSAQRLRCTANLSQLGKAAQMYWDDNSGSCFRYVFGSTNSGQILWFGWLGPGAEGERGFDVTRGALFPYLRGMGVEICPSLNYFMSQFKFKAAGAAYGYGYNLSLSVATNRPPIKITKVKRTTDIALLADAAQINDFQDPASPASPMLEEFYYIDANTNYPNCHFRHAQKGNVVFCDGHVAREKMDPDFQDQKLPQMWVGRLRPEILLLP